MSRTKSEQLAVRLEASHVAAIDELVALLAEHGVGIEPTRASVMRAALVRGLAVMKAELPTGSRSRKRKNKGEVPRA